jgi:predicted signal transduction protein with EAL and GGDEF domain
VLLDSFRQSLLIEGHAVNLTASIGIAMYPTDGTSAQDLWRLADSAMYRAKRAGGNRYVFAQHGELPDDLAELDRQMDAILQEDPIRDRTPGD